MAHMTKIDGTAYEIGGGRTLVNGTGYSINGGKTLADGTAYSISFGTPIGSFAVGTSVFLPESGGRVEYIIVNQGIPQNSTSYDDSCDGTWLLRKGVNTYHQYSTKSSNLYVNSQPYEFLTGTFLSRFDSKTLDIIKEVRIPYRKSLTNLATGANGLLTKAFLLSATEIGLTSSMNANVGTEGARLDYFKEAITDANRILINSSSKVDWWLRSPLVSQASQVWRVSDTGAFSGANYTNYSWVRPALILPSEACVDENFKVIT